MNRTTSYGCISFFMIRKFSLFCKLIRIKTSSESLFSSFMKDYSLAMEECPCCHSQDNCIFHGFYERNLIDFIQGTTVYHKISVTRVKCQSCGHTHAILPDLIIPYGQYSLFFLLRVLTEYLPIPKPFRKSANVIPSLPPCCIAGSLSFYAICLTGFPFWNSWKSLLMDS